MKMCSRSFFKSRYPTDESAFLFSGLPGHFDAAMAGKRMKLKTPETWETQVAK